MAVQYVTAKIVSYANDTSVAYTVPTGLNDGDCLLAFVYARSALTPPSGWSLVASQAHANSTITQTLYIYKKDAVVVADSGDSFTWTQASSGQMGVAYAVFDATIGSAVPAQIDTNFDDTTVAETVEQPILMADADGQMIVVCAATIEATGSSYAVTFPPDTTQMTASAPTDAYMGAAYQIADNGTNNLGEFQLLSTSTDNGLAAITITLRDNGIEGDIEHGMEWGDALGVTTRKVVTATSDIAFDIAAALAMRWRATDANPVEFDPTLTFHYRPGASAIDAAEFAEVWLENMVYGLTLAEALAFLDNTANFDTVTLLETVELSDLNQLAKAAAVAEALGIAGVLAPSHRFRRSVLESVELTRRAQIFLSGVAADSLEMTAGVVPTHRLIGVLAEALELEAAETHTLVIRVDYADDLALTDDEIAGMVMNLTLTDALALSIGVVRPQTDSEDGFTTWVMNTTTSGVTEYLNYVFNSFAKIGNRYIGANDTGLYELLGDTDDGADIIARFKSGHFQLGGARFSSFAAAYLAVRGTGLFYLKLETPDGKSYTYSARANSMQTTKIQLGKGLRSRYWSFELISTGQDFDLESLEFIPLVAQRRV